MASTSLPRVATTTLLSAARTDFPFERALLSQVTCAWTVRAADTAVIIVSHEVANFDEWKKRFDAGKDTRKKAGLTERYVMRDANKPNFVIVVLEADSVENAKKFVSDPGFK
jgi:hypothetical protein